MGFFIKACCSDYHPSFIPQLAGITLQAACLRLLAAEE